jgi:AraC family transcriptional regulator, regulatory protein of adaptative response / methylated-DNA-[protein]-cysteine methyltransferase
MNSTARNAERAAATLRDPRWPAVVARNADADGSFYYSVRTTGVYCRPSCGSRRARPENVQFHATPEDAERAGFRPCKRCVPNRRPMPEEHAEKVVHACRMIERAIEQGDSIPGLAALAERAGVSRYHFHRMFRKVTGLTPKEYAAAHRERRVRARLVEGGTVTEAIYDSGYNSNARFYAKANDVLGMTPTRYRTGGADTEIRFAVGECSLGAILVAKSERGVCAILLGDDPGSLVRDLQDRFPQADLVGGDEAFEKLVARVVGFVEAPRVGLDLPLDVRGTAFQQRVWQALREIPAGRTASYSEIAKRIGAPKSVRAVAQACGANSLAVAIPCHRVVRNDGGLSGYRWGVERKRALLAKEARQ